MKKSRNISNNKSSNINLFSSDFELDKNISSQKIQKLYRYKSYIETVLNMIKNCQFSILTNSKKPTNKYIKEVLINLNQNLNNMLYEQNPKLKNLEKIIADKKAILQNQIFINCQQELSKNHKNINAKTNSLNNLNFELDLLKAFNFKTEYDIERINNLTLKCSNDYNYLNLCLNYFSIEEKENMYLLPKYNPFITKIFHKQINDIRNKYKFIAKSKQIQNDKIENLYQELYEIKNSIIRKNKTFKEKTGIIKEESNFKKCATLYKNKNNIINKEDNNINDSLLTISDKDSIDDSDTSNNDSSESSYSSKVYKKNNDNKKPNINNNIHKHINFNMNINLNLNLNKIYNCHEKQIYNSERKRIKDNLNILNNNNKKKKRLFSTGSLPYHILNSIKGKLNSNFSFNNINFNNINPFDKYKSISEDILNRERSLKI